MNNKNEPIKAADLKEIDRKILYYLINDARQNFSKIAEKLGTTRQNISQRTKDLKEKFKFSYSIDLDLQKFDELNVKAYILFREDPNPDIREENAKLISNIPQVTNFSRVFGKYDSIIEIYAKDNNELSQIVSEIHDKTKGIMSGTETFIVHTSIKNDEKSPLKHLLTPT